MRRYTNFFIGQKYSQNKSFIASSLWLFSQLSLLTLNHLRNSRTQKLTPSFLLSFQRSFLQVNCTHHNGYGFRCLHSPMLLIAPPKKVILPYWLKSNSVSLIHTYFDRISVFPFYFHKFCLINFLHAKVTFLLARKNRSTHRCWNQQREWNTHLPRQQWDVKKVWCHEAGKCVWLRGRPSGCSRFLQWKKEKAFGGGAQSCSYDAGRTGKTARCVHHHAECGWLAREGRLPEGFHHIQKTAVEGIDILKEYIDK